MTYFIDEQIEITPVEAGDAANDGKGDLLRVSVMKLNTNINLIRDFLVGGSGRVRLNLPLPISRGGTGASSAQSARRELGVALFDCNGVLRKAESHVEVYWDRVAKGPYAATEMNCLIVKTGIGTYTLTGLAAYTKIVLPLDNTGKPGFIVEVNTLDPITKQMTFSVYSVTWLNGWIKDTLMDIPANLSFNFMAT